MSLLHLKLTHVTAADAQVISHETAHSSGGIALHDVPLPHSHAKGRTKRAVLEIAPRLRNAARATSTATEVNRIDLMVRMLKDPSGEIGSHRRETNRPCSQMGQEQGKRQTVAYEHILGFQASTY